MFVRWKRRKAKESRHGRCHAAYGDLLSAVLVESVRVDGKPRQRVIRCLASIREDFTTNELSGAHRHAFWQAVEPQLVELGADTEAIRAALLSVVPRTERDRQDALDLECRRLTARLTREHGRAPPVGDPRMAAWNERTMEICQISADRARERREALPHEEEELQARHRARREREAAGRLDSEREALVDPEAWSNHVATYPVLEVARLRREAEGKAEQLAERDERAERARMERAAQLAKVRTL